MNETPKRRNAETPAANRNGPAVQRLATSPQPEVLFVNVRVPLIAGEPAGYCARHVDRQLGASESIILRRILDGLHQLSAQNSSGRYMSSHSDALGWLLREIAAQAKG